MREQNLRLALLLYLAPLDYLFVANILAMTGVVKLPFAIGTENGESLSVQMILLGMQLVGILMLSFILERQRRRRAQVSLTRTTAWTAR